MSVETASEITFGIETYGKAPQTAAPARRAAASRRFWTLVNPRVVSSPPTLPPLFRSRPLPPSLTGLRAAARVVVIVASAAQAMFYFSQRQKVRWAAACFPGRVSTKSFSSHNVSALRARSRLAAMPPGLASAGAVRLGEALHGCGRDCHRETLPPLREHGCALVRLTARESRPVPARAPRGAGYPRAPERGWHPFLLRPGFTLGCVFAGASSRCLLPSRRRARLCSTSS